jgi:hypothetical protein
MTGIEKMALILVLFVINSHVNEFANNHIVGGKAHQYHKVS